MKPKFLLIVLSLVMLTACGKTPPPADGPIYLGPPPTEEPTAEAPVSEAPTLEPKKPKLPSVEIQAEYEGRIVYTLDQSNPDIYRDDCQKRGGTFNECGSPCPPDAEICMAACALTCELE